MTKLTTTIMAAAALLLPIIPAQAAPKKLYPDFFEFHWRWQQCYGKKIFHCDYTSRTCLSGYTLAGDDFAGVLLGEDRQTVLAHVVQNRARMWLNVDTGVVDMRWKVEENPRHFQYDREILANWRNGKLLNNCTNAYEPVPE
jgi:hypothetical protein